MTDRSPSISTESCDESVVAYQKTLDANPRDAHAHASLAQIFEARHDLHRAKQHAVSALQLEPANVVAGITLARTLLRERQFDGAEQAALALTQSPAAAPDAQALAWKLLGDARDRRGLTSEAFKAYTRSNQIQLAQYGAVRDMNHPAHPIAVRGMTAFAANVDVSRWKRVAFDTDAPVFLMGFPRSGTTLLDQVLSSHSRIICMEETEYLWDALSNVLRDGDTLETIDTLSTDKIDMIRRAYWREVREASQDAPSDAVFVDRQPLHTVLLPVIKRIFPEGKIIFALRDPRDVVLSCYQQCFAPNVTTAQFWELQRAADYYDAVMQLYDVCRERLALDLHEVRYRDVVRDLKGEAIRLASFLGVPFEERMLEYRSTALGRTINTASARQVVEPLYESSLGRWRRYKVQMAPVLPVLSAWAQRLGFES